MTSDVTVLLSPTEDSLLKLLSDVAESSTLPEQRGADVLLISRNGVVGLQRKEFPHDFLSSVHDGRLAHATGLMSTYLKYRTLVIEGPMRFFSDGRIAVRLPKHLQGIYSRFTRKSVRRIILELRLLKGVDIEYTEDLQETAELVRNIASFLGETGRKVSLYRRPGARGAWGTPSESEQLSWILQGFPGVGVTTADRVLSACGGLPLRWTITQQDLAEIIGSQKDAERIYQWQSKQYSREKARRT